MRHHYQFKSVNSKKLSLEEKQEKEQIIQSAIKRLYLPKRINESKNFNDINNSHLQTNSHNREIVNNSSFQKNSVIRNENRNSSINFNNVVNSPKSYNLTEEAETVFTTENENRILRKENLPKKEM